MQYPLEISSNAGVCSSAAAAFVAAVRAVASGDHSAAMCVGAEHSSEVLKASAIRPIDDRNKHENLHNSRWFMSVFLRFMLSDGAGAFMLKDKPNNKGVSLQVDWTHSLSLANQAPLCMKLENHNSLLSQDVSILSKYLFPTAEIFLENALRNHNESVDAYTIVLPHLSSFFFRRKLERVIANLGANPKRRRHIGPTSQQQATLGRRASSSCSMSTWASMTSRRRPPPAVCP